jgi:hypothetical protein
MKRARWSTCSEPSKARHRHRLSTNQESPRIRQALRSFALERVSKSASLRNNFKGRLISKPPHT